MTKKFDGRSRVFISHQWADKHIADRLARDLEQFAEVWLDVRNLTPGRSIQKQIDKALAEMDLILVLWSHHSAESDGVAQEVRTAVRLGKPIAACFIEHGPDGSPEPPLSEELADRLGFDLHHYGIGMARIANHIVTLNRGKLPKGTAAELEQTPEVQLMRMLTGDADSLRYTNATAKGERDYWVNAISERMAEWFHGEHGAEEAAQLLDMMERSGSDDPDYEILRSKLRHTLTREARTAAPAMNAARPKKTWAAPPAPEPSALRQRLAALVPAPQVEPFANAISGYVAASEPLLQALTAYAIAQQSAAGIQVVNAMTNYLNEEHDLIPDSQGDYGRVDDAWLIINTTYRLIESGIVPPDVVPADWTALTNADAIVRALMPPQILEALNNLLMTYLRVISAEVEHYSPQMTHVQRGYQPHLSGGCWEDDMNQMLLGTGLSV